MRIKWRSIPACTGEPTTGRNGNGAARVYPRVYGGTQTAPLHEGRPSGLSPRVRGNLVIIRAFAIFRGSIPACTGEPLRLPRCLRLPEVYPRVYGGTFARTA